MSSLTNYTEKIVLDHLLKVTEGVWPSPMYLALITTSAEVSGGAYVRQEISFGPAVNRSITQNEVIRFPTATLHWGEIQWGLIYDAQTGGNIIAGVDFAEVRDVGIGSTVEIPVGDIVVSVNSGGMSTAYANKVLDWIFRGTVLDVPSNLYMALTSANINDSDTGLTIVELNMAGYARTLCNNWDPAATGDPTTSQNTLEIATQALSGTVETVLGTALLDHAATGNVIFYVNGVNLAIIAGNVVRFPVGNFITTVD